MQNQTNRFQVISFTEKKQQVEAQQSGVVSEAPVIKRLRPAPEKFVAEILMPDGTKRYFATKPCSSKKQATKEIARHVEAIEYVERKEIYWSFIGENSYRLGEEKVSPNVFQKICRKVYGYFFEV
ncbi:hypothetical protein CN931_23855 [Bacillus sp. AFS054943]|uniref:Uncharacterized protein n=1 Tax=Bacillus cereus TaxID=1396 RepID=A0A2C1LMZ4_BACCE|nr:MULTISPECIES: DUF6018 family natural product bioysynthesis protein [Bacillus]PGL78051.1 hypothetical protein CN931_23855 [Bacillus sp. AFS054943]PGT99837.1 hypothetical protein COD19_18055 [Bacillus cereus]TKI39979.1 hypothetical protein FC700_20925 [Bacillus mycoides]